MILEISPKISSWSWKSWEFQRQRRRERKFKRNKTWIKQTNNNRHAHSHTYWERKKKPKVLNYVFHFGIPKQTAKIKTLRELNEKPIDEKCLWNFKVEPVRNSIDANNCKKKCIL